MESETLSKAELAEPANLTARGSVAATIFAAQAPA
jgi:hypothetical protein